MGFDLSGKKRSTTPPKRNGFDLRRGNNTDNGRTQTEGASKTKSKGLFNYVGKSSFETIPKYQEEKQKYQEERKSKLNATYNKYGIDPNNFSYGDFEKWAKEHNFEYQLVGDTPQNKRRVLAPKKNERGVTLASDEEITDKKTLEQLAENNERKKTSDSDQGSVGAFSLKAMDAMTLGAYSHLSDKQTKKEYKEAGLDPNEFISDTQAAQKTLDDHKIASGLGDLAGSTVSLLTLSGAVGNTLKGVKWLAKAPVWVQGAIKDGITFGLKQGTETAIDGGNAKDVAKNTAIGAVGGAAGGVASSAVGKVGEDILFKAKLQHKIIPEIIRNGTSSASFAFADSASTYFMRPKEERPSVEEVAKNMAVNFAFAAITTGINTGKIKQSSKEALDTVNNKMMKDYDSMVKAANKHDIESAKKLAKNVMEYSDSMSKYLDGEGFEMKSDAPTDTVTAYLTGKGKAPTKNVVLDKARFVGESSRVRTMQEDLATIKNSAQEFYDRVNSIPYDVPKVSETSKVGNVDNITKSSTDVHTDNVVKTSANVNAENNAPLNKEIVQNVPKTTFDESIQEVQEQAPTSANSSDTTTQDNAEVQNDIETPQNVQDDVTDGDTVSETISQKYSEDLVKTYVNSFIEVAKNSPQYPRREFFNNTENIADELSNRVLTGKSNLDGNSDFEFAVKQFEYVLNQADENKLRETEQFNENNTSQQDNVVTQTEPQNITDGTDTAIDESTTAIPIQKEPQNITDSSNTAINEDMVVNEDAVTTPTQTTETGELSNGVQSSIQDVTRDTHDAMNRIGVGVSQSATGIQEANTKFISNNDNLFDRNYVSNYANDFVQAMSEKNGRSYSILSNETDNLADELVNKTLTGNSVLDGNREFQTVVRNFKDVLREGIKKNANLHNNVYGANEVLNAQVQDVENGDYSSLNISENANNNIKFTPVSENGQNVGYVIKQGVDYTNQLSETSFAVKQKNGEYEAKQGVTYGRFGTHQSSNGNYIVSYLPTGDATAILPNQDTAIEFMKQVENETSGYSIYLHNDNDGIPKTGGEISQFINTLNTVKSNLQVKENSVKEIVGANSPAVSVENATQKDNSAIEIPKSDIKTNETLPVSQLLEDYNDTVDNILSVSDETAKELADNRVAVEILKNTPNVILDNVKGARDLKVIINYTKLYLAVRKNGVFEGHYHNLGAEIAKKLPDFLQNPDAIIQLANGKLNLFTTVKTKKGNNGIISVELNSTKDIGGKNEDYNVVVTMFSSNDNYTKNLISGEGVNIKYKKEDLSQVNPQLYKWLATINDKSSTNNIVSQDSDVVNSSIRRDTENDTLNLKDKCNLTQTKHTKTGEDLWVIGLKERISADEYKKLNAKVKAVGGYYSRYAKTPDGKPIPGFIFKAEPTEEVFDAFNDFFKTTGTLKETDDVQADENVKDSQSTNNNTESDEENVSENNKTVLNSQSENDTIKEKPDLEIGDVIEYDGRQWEVTQTGLNMSFKNLDKSDSKQTFSHIGTMENFKQTHDYKIISKADNSKNINEVKDDDIDKSRKILENSNRIDKSKTGIEAREIFQRRNSDNNISGGLSRIDEKGCTVLEKRKIQEVAELDSFKKLSWFVANEISADKNKNLYKKYENDSRWDEGYDFREMVTYDMLTDSQNELRVIFNDNIAEYFNKYIDPITDITGKKLPLYITKGTKNSIVKNKHGQLIPLYHGTGSKFNEFKCGDIGIHFGSYSQAIRRVKDKGITNPIYIKAYLNITNPIYIDKDFWNWNADQVVADLDKQGIISSEDGLKILNIADLELKNSKLREILKNKGYDGIVYNNEIEAISGKSYIVFDDKQIFRTNTDTNQVGIKKADNQKNGGKENGISQQGVLDGKSRNDDRGLHARTDGTNEESGIDGVHTSHSDDSNNGLRQSVGNERNRPDVRDDSEGIYGGTDKRETTSETEGVSDGGRRGRGTVHNGGIDVVQGMGGQLGQLKDNTDDTPDVIETGAKTVKKEKLPSNKNNFVISNDFAEKYDTTPPSAKDNLDAIELLLKLEEEGREATNEEKEILAKYKGWGGIDTRRLPYEQYSRFNRYFDGVQRKNVQDSMNNAFFTPTKVVDAMYNGLKRLGFKGGNVLETSMGIGNFFGRMPVAMTAKSALTGVELETYTARIAQYLYSGATVINKPFQDIAFKNNSYDLVIGNVPFGQNKISYDKKKYSMHNYFIISSLDKVREGGIVAVITSSGTLDSYGIDARKAIMDRADVVACYKLPEGVFSRSANTGVQSDLLILQKRASGQRPSDDSILNVTTTDDGLRINEYFKKHPENILGTLAKGANAWGEITTVIGDGNFYEKLNDAMSKLPKGLMNGKSELKKVETLVSWSEKPKFFEKGGRIYEDDGAGTATALKGTKENTARDYIAVRDVYKELLEAYEKELPDNDIEILRKKLSEVYDDFYKKHGPITGDGKKKIGKKKSTNNSFLKSDSDFYLVGGLERYDKAKKEFAKSVLFEKDTLRKKKITKVDTASDALVVSINETGKVDFKHMQELTGKTEKQIADELKGEIVLTPQGDYVLTDIYLSGNIYEKLDEVKGKPGFEEQEKMLEQVLPKPKNASEIIVKLGANYIDPKCIERFALDTFGQRLNVEKDSSGKWKIDGAGQRRYGEIVNTKYGCKAFNAVQLLEKVLNDGEILAKMKSVVDGKEVVTIDTKMTEVAKQKAEDIKNVFNSWIFRDSERRNVIVNRYNRMYNNYRPLNYKNIAEKLSFDSMSEELKEKLYPHQKNGIARFLFGGNTLFAHGVGTGKTFEMIASVMEAKRMGIINKTAMVVPNNKVVDFRNDIAEAYPTAKVLVIDTAKAKRQSMLGLVNSNDWDIVLIARTTFTKIPVSKQLEANFISQQLEECNIQIAEAESNRDGSTRAYKNLIKKRNNLEDKLKNLNADTKRDENGIEFEKLGFDAICVDEAHNYKSITTPTSLSIKGLANSSSAQQANDMLMKLDYLRSINGKIVFGTGTPITNTVSEIYNMMRMVRPDILEEAGIHSLDEWVNTFAKIENTVELGIDGQIKPKSTQVIRSFVNASEMIGLFRQFADIVFTEDVVKDLPKAKYVDIKIEGTPEHKQIQQQITDTLANTNKKEMLKVYARLMAMADMASVDTRMLSGAETDVNMYKDYSVDELEHENSKINTMCKQVLNEYKNSNDIKGTQIIFCDKGAGSGEVYSFNLHKDIKNKLIERGIPEEEIVIISNQKDAQLEELYEKVNNGDVRVLIGTCQKMAEGLNVQKRVVAIHHPTVTYKPSDWEQSNARGVRSGNINKEVRIYRYLQENTFDSHKWQAQDRKGEMIRAALRGDAISEMEDVGASDDGGESIDAATAMAITSGNPLVKEKIDIDKEVSRLKTLEQGYLNEIYHYQDVVAKNPRLIEEYTDREKGLKNDIISRDKYNENEIIIKDKRYEKQKDANKALSEAIKSAPKNGKYNTIGSYNGFKIKFKGNTGGMDYSLIIQGVNTYTVEYAGGANNIARIAGVLKRLDSDLSNTQNSITKFKDDLEFAKQEVKKPFEKETELREAIDKQKDITYKYEHYNETSANQKEDDVSKTIEKVVNKTDMSSDIQYSKQSNDNTVDSWTSDVAQSNKNQKNKKLGDIVSYISKEFNIPISKGNLSIAKAKGEFKKMPRAVRLRVANDLPTVTHELGHLLDSEYDLTSLKYIDDVIDFAQQKNPTLMSLYTQDEIPGESVAEFVREFVKDPQSTIKEVPRFSKEFIERLEQKDAQALKTLSEYVQGYFNSGFMDKVSASMTTNKEIEQRNRPTILKKTEETYTKIVDDFFPIKKATDYVKHVKGELNGEYDAYVLALNSRNTNATTVTILKEGMVDANGNLTGGKGLIDCIKEVPRKDLELFDKYLVLKHSLEWLEPKEGVKAKRVFSDETLQDTKTITENIKQLEKEHPEFKKAADNLYNFQKEMLKYWVVNTGGMNIDTFNELQKRYPHYVPFMRDISRSTKGYKNSFANQQSPIKNARGSGATIISPLESIMRNVEKYVKFGTRNKVMGVLALYADDISGFANFIEPVPPDQIKKTVSIRGLSDKFLKVMSENLNDNDLYTLTEAFDDIFGTQIESYTPVVIPGKQIVTWLENGEYKYYQIHDKALFDAITNLTPTQADGILNFGAKILGVTNTLITELNPVFATTNMVRDFDTAMKNSEAYNNPVTFTAAYMSALWDVITNSDSYKQYKAAGGGHMSNFSDNIDVLKRTLSQVSSKDAGLARRFAQATFLHPIYNLTRLNEITESVPRLAEFKGMKKKGADNQQAIYAASDITVNFNKSGEVGRKLNKIFRFSNATVQGMDKQVRVFTTGGRKKIAKHILRYLISAILTTALLEFWNRTSDEDGWEELSQYQKNNFYCIATGNGKFIKIPKAREAAILNTTTERAIEYAFDDKEAFYQFGQYLGDTILPAWLPITGIAEGGIEEGLHQVAGGTIFGGIVDNMVNKDFKGTPIVSSALEDEPSKAQYNSRTSLLAKEIGQVFGWSPMKIDHLIDNYTGILGKINRAVTSDGFNPSTIYGNSYSADSAYSTDVFNKVYERRDKMFKKYQNNPTPQNACMYEKYASKATYITQANKAIKRLSESEQRKARQELISDVRNINSGITDTDKSIVGLFNSKQMTTDDGYMSSLPQSKITMTVDKQSYIWEMTYTEYKKYYEDYQKVLEANRKKLINTSKYQGASDNEKTEMLKQLGSDVLKAIKDQYKEKNKSKFKKDE